MRQRRDPDASRDFVVASLRRWLDEEPPSYSAARYDRWARQRFDTGDDPPPPAAQTVFKVVGVRFKEAVSVAGGDMSIDEARRLRLERLLDVDRYWLGKDQAALILEVAPKTIIHRAEQGRLPAHVRFTPDAPSSGGRTSRTCATDVHSPSRTWRRSARSG